MDLSSFGAFVADGWMLPIKQRYEHDSFLAEQSVAQMTRDLKSLNDEYTRQHNRTAFTTVEGRVKSEASFMRKLYRTCCEEVQKLGMSPKVLDELFGLIHDLCGVRFSCPYFDEVKLAIDDLVRPGLARRGYATDLQGEKGLEDKEYLDDGDALGYRAYHFFVRVPVVVDIWGNVEPCLCEVQARTELQHVWAVKSHDLLYKKECGWDFSAQQVVEDMRQVSNSLRSADQFLVSIRNRLKGERRHDA